MLIVWATNFSLSRLLSCSSSKRNFKIEATFINTSLVWSRDDRNQILTSRLKSNCCQIARFPRFLNSHVLKITELTYWNSARVFLGYKWKNKTKSLNPFRNTFLYTGRTTICQSWHYASNHITIFYFQL